MIFLIPFAIFLRSIDAAGRQYIVVNEHKTWDEAQQYCLNQYGGNLAAIIDQKDLDAFSNARHLGGVQPSQPVWIGLVDIHHEGNWYFVDGTV